MMPEHHRDKNSDSLSLKKEFEKLYKIAVTDSEKIEGELHVITLNLLVRSKQIEDLTLDEIGQQFKRSIKSQRELNEDMKVLIDSLRKKIQSLESSDS